MRNLKVFYCVAFFSFFVKKNFFVAGVQLSELSKASYLKLSEDVLSHGGLFKWSYFATMSASEDCTDVLRRDGCRLALTATKPFYNEH